MMKRLLFIFLSITTLMGLHAQNPFSDNDTDTQPIRWSGTARLTSPTEGVITLTATMEDGWHLYGLNMPDNGPKPTRFTFEVAKGVELVGKLTTDSKPRTKTDAMFNMTVSYWENKVVFAQHFRLSPDATAINHIACSVVYMGCNDKTCLPPKTKNFKLRILPAKK